MRSFFGSLAGAALLLLVSCTDNLQETIIPHEGDLIELTAYADNGVATKTGIVDNGNGGKNVVWKSGNAISLFFNSGDNGGNKFTTTDSGPVATFKGSISAISGSLEETGGKAYFWGLYPYNASASCDGTNITTTLPSSQLAYQGDVADDLLVTVGRSENLAMSFKNACAVIGFTLSQDNISKVTFSGRNNEYVAGEFKASFNSSNQLTVAPTSNGVKSIKIIPAEAATFTKGKTYYFAILPGTFSSGYSLTFTKADGTTATYKRTSSFTFAISTFYTMTNKDSGLTFTSGQGTNPTENITFADSKVKTALVNKFDTDGDGDLSKGEAAAVTSLEGVFGAIKTYKSFDEFQYFTNVSDIPESMFAGWRLTSIKLPESIRTIGANAFNGCTSLESIAIPEGIIVINAGTFSGCTNLCSISLPSRLTTIGDSAFSGCSTIEFELPTGINRYGRSAFAGCMALKSIIIQDGVEYFPDSLFFNCTNLSSITIPNSISHIGSYAFSQCTSLQSIDLPDSLRELGEGAFSGCTTLKRVSIPYGITILNRSLFRYCCSLERIVIPESVTIIENGTRTGGVEYGCFSGCSSLSTVLIPESVSSIGDDTFSNCTNLTSIVIPESVTSIGGEAFMDCTGLETIVIPESVTIIGHSAFMRCSNLSRVEITDIDAWCNIIFRDVESNPINCAHHIYLNGEEVTTLVIPNSVTSIGGYAFYGCTGLTSITIPNSVTSIGDYAFYGCTGLTSITIPNSVTSIGYGAFYTGLTSVTVLNETPPQLKVSKYYSPTFPSNTTIYVPKNSVDAYKSADGWKNYASQIQAIPE